MNEEGTHLFARRMLARFPHDKRSEDFLAALLEASIDGHMCLHSDEDPGLPKELIGELVVCEENRWYLKRNWDAEKSFIAHWDRLRGSVPTLPFAPQPVGVGHEQANAVLNCSNRCLSIICGGPGTGKTFTAVQLITLFLEQTQGRVAVAAPTGKAAARLKEGLGEVAAQCTLQTLHALLSKEGFLPFDLLVVDEGSMIDAALMARLFASVKEGARLALLGDHEQLPPVESGNLFQDLVRHEDVALLTTCLRTDLKEILELAHAAQKGEALPYVPLPKIEALLPMILERLDFTAPDRFRVLCPLRGGPFGVDRLNASLFERAPRAAPIPILITVNDKRLGLFNGDTGILLEDEAHFPGGRRFPRSLLPPWELSYALSVHKSQGSEYDEVMLLLPEGSEHFSRSMLYTAITRAKKKVEILGHEGVVEQLLRREERRASGVISRPGQELRK